MESLSKDEFVRIMLATSACLHHEPGYRIDKPQIKKMDEVERELDKFL